MIRPLILSLPSIAAAFWLVFGSTLVLGESLPGSVKTALDAYIAEPDSSYGYDLVRTLPNKGFTAYILKMRSQTWLSKELVDRPLWEHDLKIIVPETVRTNGSLLFIGGGANGRDAPDSVKEELAKVAMATGSVVAELGQVPNQPLRFVDDPKKEDRTEDSLIAYTWTQFLEGGDARWLARFPMTKSTVRAMDTVTAFCASDDGGEVDVQRFAVAGGSKRGWTTWMTAAVDKRVVAIVPIVIDMLNVRPSFQHHYQAYGFFAPAVGDYVEQGIMEWQDTPEYEKLVKLVEPYEYRSRLTMPKLLLNATGDQFFLPDSSQFYFADLPGEKHLRYVPNADHSMRGTDAYETLLAYYAMILTDQKRPEVAWTSKREGHLLVTSNEAPKQVLLWQAHNPTARDFRVGIIGAAWKSSVVLADDQGRYEASVSKPKKGWTAMFLEMTYPTAINVPFKTTTNVEVIPKTLPFPPFKPKRGNGE